MEACAVICRKATFTIPDAISEFPDANSPSSRAQNRGFCAFLAFGSPVFGHYEHKIGVFVRFWPSGPLFSGISSTKSWFLCFFGLRDPRFRAFRAQNRSFCALLPFGSPVFGHFEHKIGVFVRFWGSEPQFSGISSTKSGFLCFFDLRNPRFRAFRAQNRGFCAFLPSGTPVFRLFEHKIEVFVLVKLMCGIGSLQF